MKAMARWTLLGALALSAMACNKEPDQATIHREAGDDFFNKSEWAKAAEEYDKSLAADPKQEKVWERKAFVHMKAGEMDKFEAALLKEAELRTEPAKKAEVYRNIAGVYMQDNKLDKAEPWFNKALEADPNDDQALQWLGELYSQRGGARDMKAAAQPPELEKAIGYYDRLIKIKPDAGVAYLNKRIAVNKLMEWEAQQQRAADIDLQNAGNDKDAAAQAEVDKHKARVEELKKQFEELTKKLTELAKNPPPPAPAPPAK